MANKTTHPRNPKGVEISITPDMIEDVFIEWEKENPGKRGHIDMGGDEFSRRMMIRIRASARFIPDG